MELRDVAQRIIIQPDRVLLVVESEPDPRDTRSTRPVLAESGLSAIRRASYWSDKAKAGRPFVQAMAAGKGDPQGVALARAALGARGTDAVQASAMQGALTIAEQFDRPSIADALADAAGAAARVPSDTDEKIGAASAHVEAIPGYGPVDHAAAEHIASTGLDVIRSASYWSQKARASHVFVSTLARTCASYPYTTLATVASRAGGTDTVRASVQQAALTVLSQRLRNASTNELLNAAAGEAMRIPSDVDDKIGAAGTFADGIQEPLTERGSSQVAQTGLDLMRTASYWSQKARAGYTFTQALSRHSEHRPFAEVAEVAAHAGGTDAVRASASQGAMTAISEGSLYSSTNELLMAAADRAMHVPSDTDDKIRAATTFAAGVRTPLGDRTAALVAQTGLSLIRSASYWSQKSEAGRAFVETLARYSANEAYSAVARAALRMGGSHAAQASACQAVLEVIAQEPRQSLPLLLVDAAQHAERIPSDADDKTGAMRPFMQAMV